VVVVGAGFGGLRAARALRDAPVHATIVDRHNYHLFQPLLYQVATAGLSPEDIAHPVRAILRRQRNAAFRLAEVEAVDLAAKRVDTTTGPVPYDFLVLAVGGATNFLGLRSLEANALPLKDIEDAVAIRNHVLRTFELAAQEPDPDHRRALLTVVVVGGGPTGVESAGALSELVRLVLTKDFPALDVKDVRVVLLEATDRLLAGFPERLREYTGETLWRKHVEVRFGARVVAFDGERVTLQGGEVIPARTLLWAAGVRAAPLAERLHSPRGPLGRLAVRPTLQLPDYDEVFAIGDAAFVEAAGDALPMMAPVAIQQGELAARNVLHLVRGEPLEPFRYRDPGSLATIGRTAAVARLGRFQFTGFLAWTLWLVVHIVQLIGFRNRLLVLVNWAWDYFLYDRAVRLITRAEHGAARAREAAPPAPLEKSA
jgi:NADH dehydrogenase